MSTGNDRSGSLIEKIEWLIAALVMPLTVTLIFALVFTIAKREVFEDELTRWLFCLGSA